MEPPTSLQNRVKSGAVALALSGLLFVIYPASRPFSDESSLEGAEALASVSWLFSHFLAMLAFILLMFGLQALHQCLRDSARERLMFVALVLAGFSVGLVLTFYGAETYGLNAIAREALARQDPNLLNLAGDVRGGFGLMVFVLALLMLAISAIIVAAAVWTMPGFSRWAAALFAVGFALYIPQFMGSKTLRVLHGSLIMVACVWLSVAVWKHAGKEKE